MGKTEQQAVTARTLRPGEPPPEQFGETFLHLRGLDREWIWIVEHSGMTVGLLIAAPCHGIGMILRVRTDPDTAPRSALLVLLRKFFSDLRARGYQGFMSWFDETNDDERILQKIAEQLGGLVVSRPGVAVASFLPPEGT